MSIEVAKLLKDLGLGASNQGAWSAASGWLTGKAGRLDSLNPATAEVIASVQLADATEYDQVLREAQQAFKAWREVPAPKRGELVRQMGEALRTHKDALGSLVALEMGKIKPEGDGEVQEMLDIADFAVGQSRMLYGNTMHSERPRHRMYEQWHPLGVVGIISAFNFPVAVWSWNAFLAAICGNAVVWKPSPKTPLSAIAVQHICNKVLTDNGYPGVFSLLVGDNVLAEKFVKDERVALMSFTGSSAIGRKVGEIVAARMGKSLLELGGNNAIILDETADLNMAIPAIAFGAVGTAGQRCTSTRRLIVQESIHDALVEKLANAYRQVRIGNPLDSKTVMGPLVDGDAVKRYEHAIAEIKKVGGTIVYGGKKIDGPGFFVEPTIVTGVANDAAIIQTETFAPILYVLKYKTLDEAIALHNAVPQGLSSAIFTLNMRNAERFLSAIGSDCGIANVNIGTSGAEIGGAFGGEKETGGGRESGSDAWKQYMRRQTNTINWGTELPLAQGIKFELS